MSEETRPLICVQGYIVITAIEAPCLDLLENN